MSGAARSRPSEVFLDTHGLLAALNADDAHHRAAVAFFASLSVGGTRVFTSDWVLAEFLSVASRKPLRRAAAGIVEDLQGSAFATILEANRHDWDRAFRVFRARRDKAWSFVDCTSILLCGDLGIDAVLTHDHHFKQPGLGILLP